MKKIRIMNLVFPLLLILVLALGTACALPLGKGLSPTSVSLSDNSNISITYSDQSASVLPSIADVVAAAKPSVVAIDTETTFQIFRRSFTQQGVGSGWIINKNGIIVTNNHVIDGAQTITITLADGRTFTVDPNTIAADPSNDLAVIKIDAENLPAVKIGDSSALRVGDWLVAIGNPLGLGVSAKEGIASRLGVSLSLEGQTLNDLIETSAAINPGNSGGPLVNMKGEVIGITSAKIASVGVEGLGYAISINQALPIIEKLIASKWQ